MDEWQQPSCDDKAPCTYDKQQQRRTAQDDGASSPRRCCHAADGDTDDADDPGSGHSAPRGLTLAADAAIDEVPS
jgi:hypothetical protein